MTRSTTDHRLQVRANDERSRIARLVSNRAARLLAATAAILLLIETAAHPAAAHAATIFPAGSVVLLGTITNRTKSIFFRRLAEGVGHRRSRAP